MERVKLFIAVGLCVALMMVPLAGMAGNPLPINNSADGHPWDDGDNTPDPGDTIIDSTINIEDKTIRIDLESPEKSAFCLTIVWKWYLLLIW